MFSELLINLLQLNSFYYIIFGLGLSVVYILFTFLYYTYVKTFLQINIIVALLMLVLFH